MNKLLLRQITKFAINLDEETRLRLMPFLKAVSDTYDDYHKDRDLMERSLDLTSQELTGINEKIRQESLTQKLILNDLRSATAALRPTGYKTSEWLTTKDEVTYLANSLTKLISERKLAEEELKKSNRELEISKIHTEQEKAKAEAILKSIGDGVFAVNLQGKIILMNKLIEELTGYTFEEAKNQSYKNIFHFILEKKPSADYPDFIEEVIKTGTIKSMANHTLLLTKNGSKIPVSDSAAPIKDEAGNIFGSIVVVRDVSRERALEQAKDNFISTAAHQLRTPLGSIRWSLEILLTENTLPTEVKNEIQRIYNTNRRTIRLVNDLLNVSRIEQGAVPDKLELTDINKTIKNIVSEMTEIIQHKAIIIEFLETASLSKIMTEAKLFQEVVQNILSNAVKYNYPNGKIIIKSYLKEKYACLSIADTGIGIPQKEQARVFTKFFRAENAILAETEGSGLGLFMVKSYIERWGGRIYFESQEGKGTTFTLELPVFSIINKSAYA